MGIVGTTLIKDLSRDTGIEHTTDRVSAGSDSYRFIASQDFMVTYDSKCEHTGV